MASTNAGTSSATTDSTPEMTVPLPPSRPPSYVPPEAGPLPSKVGELGFVEGVHVQAGNQASRSEIVLPERHPADRDAPPSAEEAQPPATANPAPSATAGSPSTPPASTSEEPANKPQSFKNKTILGGIRIATFIVFAIQVLILGLSVTAWVFTSQKVAVLIAKGGFAGGTPSTIFIHVVFAFGVIGQLIFLERRIYTIRAERYAYLHPGEMLPRYRDRTRQGGDLSFAYAPWNRPPLPTYAAVLAQSGHGTGDVEDHIIAVSPPPAYGNTRGSRMLLQGFLTDELRAQRPPSAHSARTVDLERGEGGEMERSPDREQQREETLAQLENSRGRT